MFFGGIGSFFFVSGILIGFGVLIHYGLTSSFSPYKFLGFTSLAFLFFGLLMYLTAIITNIFKRLRISQEELMYQTKLIRFGK